MLYYRLFSLEPMDSKLVFIYDGHCPFCNYFAELLELKSSLPNIQIKNARGKPIEIPQGYDMTFAELPSDTKNAISHRANALAAFKSWLLDPDSKK